MTNDLTQKLVAFANELVAEQWHSLSSYETTTEDMIREAIAECKVDIGTRLLKVLEGTKRS